MENNHYYPTPGLRTLGISCTIPSYEEVTRERTQKQGAFCTSFTCSGSHHGYPIRKTNVLRNQSECPDCRNALLWKTLTAKHLACDEDE